MNTNELIYNLALSAREVEDVMNSLADKANILSALQSKVYAQALGQKKEFDDFQKRNVENAITGETTEAVEELITPTEPEVIEQNIEETEVID